VRGVGRGGGCRVGRGGGVGNSPSTNGGRTTPLPPRQHPRTREATARRRPCRPTCGDRALRWTSFPQPVRHLPADLLQRSNPVLPTHAQQHTEAKLTGTHACGLTCAPAHVKTSFRISSKREGRAGPHTQRAQLGAALQAPPLLPPGQRTADVVAAAYSSCTSSRARQYGSVPPRVSAMTTSMVPQALGKVLLDRIPMHTARHSTAVHARGVRGVESAGWGGGDWGGGWE
jgi:hypothetical protein